jgi:NhaA family Na+:H+ antiporter
MLHPWVAFFVMPLFALANAGVPFQAADVVSPVAIAVVVGLAVGKLVGILLMSWLSIRAGVARLPEGVNWIHMTGGGFLAGIGFTMALFIAGLAYSDDQLLKSAKVGVLTGSVVSAVLGMTILYMASPNTPQENSAN